MVCFLLVLVVLLQPNAVKAQNSNAGNGREVDSNIQHQVEKGKDVLYNLWKYFSLDLSSDTVALNLSDECMESVNSISPSDWAVLVDASGKLGAGLLSGNVLMDGAFDECFSYNFTAFCVADYINFTIPTPLSWTVGLCVPKHCTNVDIAIVINSTGILISNQTQITCANSKTPPISIGAAVMTAVCSLFVGLVISATIIDSILQRLSFTSVSTSCKASETMALLESKDQNRSVWKANCIELITSFSLLRTVPTLLATHQGPNVISCLNGLRVMSMFWVILGHSYSLLKMFTNVDNFKVVRNVSSRLSFQAVESASFSVDSFFFLSGVLVSYLTLREIGRLKGRFPILAYYIHRYLRLTPAFAFVTFFAWFLHRHLTVGPYSALKDPFKKECSKYWWTNLIYINNIYPWRFNDQCMSWVWYLANDMQFYALSPLILYFTYRKLPIGATIAGLFLVASFAVTGSLSGVYNFQANMESRFAFNYTNKPGAPWDYVDDIYTKPWGRMPPYIVGLALGYVLYKKYSFKYSKAVNTLLYLALWGVATCVALCLVYGLYFTWHGHIPHTAENVIYITFSKFLWACCLALVVFACHNGYGSVVNSFLSMKLWIPLYRMTYCAFLIHPLVIMAVYGQLQTPIHYTDVTMATFFVAFVVFSYAGAAVLCVGVELPLGTLESLVYKLLGSKGRESQRQDRE